MYESDINRDYLINLKYSFLLDSNVETINTIYRRRAMFRHEWSGLVGVMVILARLYRKPV